MNKIYIFLFGIIFISFMSTTLSFGVQQNTKSNNYYIDETMEFKNFQSNKCQICELMVKDVIECLTSNVTVGDMKKLIGLLCFRVIPFYTKDCAQFIDCNLEKIIEIIEDNGDPNTVCEKIGACSSSDEQQIDYDNYKDGDYYCESKKTNIKKNEYIDNFFPNKNYE